VYNEIKITSYRFLVLQT